jgi:hypothetical protein
MVELIHLLCENNSFTFFFLSRLLTILSLTCDLTLKASTTNERTRSLSLRTATATTTAKMDRHRQQRHRRLRQRRKLNRWRLCRDSLIRLRSTCRTTLRSWSRRSCRSSRRSCSSTSQRGPHLRLPCQVQIFAHFVNR